MLTYELDPASKEPLYIQLYNCIRKDILRGEIAGGSRLPSKRSLADHLGISRITVENAYAQLVSEGYISAKERSGCFAEAIPQESVSGAAEASGARMTEKQPETAQGLSLAAEQFPFSVWAKLMRSVILDNGPLLFAPAAGQGTFSLRSSIAEDLRKRRGMDVDPARIIIGSGAEYFYNMLIQFFGRQVKYGLESLGHKTIAYVYRANEARICPILMDEGGIRPSELERCSPDIIHITPSHHYPTGIVMPVSRRIEILNWAAEKEGRYIIEDDYDSEFRFSGKPIQSLQSLDQTGKVIYINTFSRTIAPALRISYMILPERLGSAWKEKMGFYSCTVPAFDQLTLTKFLEGGYYERHINRMRKFYRDRLEKLRKTAEGEDFPSFCRLRNAQAGLHFVLQFRTDADDAFLGELLTGNGLPAKPLKEFAVDKSVYFKNYAAENERSGMFVVNYADLSADTFRKALEAVKQSAASR